MFEEYEGTMYNEETSKEIWQAGYDEGHEQGLIDCEEETWQRGYDEGYMVGTHDLDAAKEQAYEEGYADGEELLYSKDNPIEVITEMEHEINIALTSPTTSSYEDTLKMIQGMCQVMLQDWGQFVK